MNQHLMQDLQALKKKIDLVAFIRSHGIELKQQGKNFIGCCPFHQDKTPSLSVTPQKQLWNCFGACNQGGDIINWIMKFRGVSNKHAIEMLKEQKLSTLITSKPLKLSQSLKLGLRQL